MQNLSRVIVILFIAQSFLFAQKSPHGKNLNIDCSFCHTTDTWKVDIHKIKFDHNKTGFKLIGQHNQVPCTSCHKSLKFENTPQNCSDCHNDVHQNSVGFQCEDCHTPKSWVVTNILEIHQKSRFPLLGAHQTIDCQECHLSASLLNFKPIGIDCYQCHKSQYEATTNPNHQQAGYGTDCESCHAMSTWAPATIDHDGPYFPIYSGEHNGVWSTCRDCHTNYNDYSIFSCTNCHAHNKTSMDSEHSGINGYTYESVACYACHPRGSSDDAFNHSLTGFPLTGVHTTVSCSSCHTNGYAGTPTICISCHQDNYNSAPEHVSQNYPTTCEQCHNTTTWSDVTFDHNSTNFPLTGAHTTVSCSNCHTNGYAGTPTQCNDCHNSDYLGTTNPNHQSLSLSTECQTCHTTNPGWSPAQFPDHNNYYQLLGAHANIANDCASCHNGDYNNTPTECYGCHQSDYNNTTDPPHLSAQFPTDCEICHTQNAWVPSTFDHDGQYFPIFSGSHNGEWNSCSDCHTNSSDYSVFSCITCHEHNQSSMDEEHSEVSGYVYESSACYSCHPTGSGEGEGGGGKFHLKKILR